MGKGSFTLPAASSKPRYVREKTHPFLDEGRKVVKASKKNVLHAFVKHKRKFGLEKSNGLKNG